MTQSPRFLRAAVLSVTFVLAACGSATVSESPAVSPSAPVALASASPTPVPSAIPSIAPTPSPTPAAPPKWAEPELVGGGDCASVTAVIDEAGTYHVAAVCHQVIRYAVQKGGGWSIKTFTPPAERLDFEPQLAFDGNTLYLAFSRIAVVEGACGDDGTRGVGVYYRQRTLPDGAWSSARRLDDANERLQSFRVSAGILHATATDVGNGRLYYVASDAGTFHRYQLTGAVEASLRIGSDGKPRVAYSTGDEVRYATFDGSQFSTSPIPKGSRGISPLLVVDGQNHAHVLYARSSAGGGCVEPGPEPEDGTYYATNASGKWVSTRISRATGEMSFTVNANTAEVHVVLHADGPGLRYLTNTLAGGWTSRMIASGTIGSPVIRLDPANGNLLVAYVGRNDAVYVLTRK